VTPADIASLIIGGLGLLIAGILGIRELQRERRSLKIILEYEHWTDRSKVFVTNTGHRPITIVEILVGLSLTKKEQREGVDLRRRGSFWATEEGYEPPELPLTLEDGEMATFYLSDGFCNEMMHDDKKFGIAVYDAEGHTYSKYTEREYDVKYGYRMPRYKGPNFYQNVKWKIEYWWRNRGKK
jgi:hypothetical protein